MRAISGTVATDSARMTEKMPGPKIAAMASPTRIAGKDSMMSTRRMIGPSSQRW